MRHETVATVLALSLFLALSSCTVSSERLEFERGEAAAQRGDNAKALEHFSRIVEKFNNTPKAIRAAQEAARISNYELKRYPEAIKYYKHVILYASEQKDRIAAQKRIAELHFAHTLNYQEAITEYNRLLELPHSPAEAGEYRMAIARSYFYLNNFYQAQVEIDRILAGRASAEMAFEARLLKANIFLTTKKLDEAIEVLKELIEKDPVRAKKETIGLVLAVCYEEQKNFAKAIETLESLKESYPRREFIENKIRILKERQTYLPGARGLRK